MCESKYFDYWLIKLLFLFWKFDFAGDQTITYPRGVYNLGAVEPGNLPLKLPLKCFSIQIYFFLLFLTDTFLDVDNDPSPKVLPPSVEGEAAKNFQEEIDCLISVDLHTVDRADGVDTSAAIPAHKYYSKTNRPKPRTSVTIGLDELNVGRRKRRKKGPKLCMPTKRKRTRHTFTSAYEEVPPDSICKYIPPVRHVSVDSGVDITDNVDGELIAYADKYNTIVDEVDCFPSRTLGKSVGTYMLSGRHGPVDVSVNSFPLFRNSASYRCPCCP